MLPPLLDIAEIQTRLLAVFPEGTPQRGYCTREMAARTVFVMLYIGAVEGAAIWLGPKHVYRMSASQSAQRDDAQRQDYAIAVEKPGFVAPADRWFQDNTREPIRDEDASRRAGACQRRRSTDRVTYNVVERTLCSAGGLRISFRPGFERRAFDGGYHRLAGRQSDGRRAGARAAAAAIRDSRRVQNAGQASKWRDPPNGSGTILRHHQKRSLKPSRLDFSRTPPCSGFPRAATK